MFKFSKGAVQPDQIVSVRMQSQNTIDEIIDGESKSQTKLNLCLKYFQTISAGVLIYIQKKQSYEQILNSESQNYGIDEKNIGVGAQILKSMNLKKINLITDTPKNLSALKAFGLEIVQHTSFMDIVKSLNKSNTNGYKVIKDI
jgi:3,4-dihydroxy 2-butanone 4-phosphate synthase / GTP cyclohydrolase II